MKHLIIILALLTSFNDYSQGTVVLNDRPFLAQRKQDTAIANQLQQQPLFRSLNKSSQELIYWVNLMRKHPSRFNERYVQPFLEQFPEANSREAKELISKLSTLSPMPMLNLSSTLMQGSNEHAAYLSERKQISHTGKGGKSFQSRMAVLGISGCAGENIFDGQDDALMALILLLIDKGVPGAGHREALLNGRFTTTGIGVYPMDAQRMVFVQQFGCN